MLTKIRLFNLLLPIATALGLSSCASIVSKTARPVTITSNPTGAAYSLKKSNGMVMSEGVTPATIVLSTSKGFFQPARYVIEFKRNGAIRTVPLNASLNGWYLGNFIFGGLIGLLIVDPATGAMWTLDETVVANLDQTACRTGERTLEIRTIDQIPPSLRKNLTALR